MELAVFIAGIVGDIPAHCLLVPFADRELVLTGPAGALLEQYGWKIIIASAGCEWYIQQRLADVQVMLEVHANPGTYSPAKGMEMRLPTPSPVQPFESWREIAQAWTTPNREQP